MKTRATYGQTGRTERLSIRRERRVVANADLIGLRSSSGEQMLGMQGPMYVRAFQVIVYDAMIELLAVVVVVVRRIAGRCTTGQCEQARGPGWMAKGVNGYGQCWGMSRTCTLSMQPYAYTQRGELALRLLCRRVKRRCACQDTHTHRPPLFGSVTVDDGRVCAFLLSPTSGPIHATRARLSCRPAFPFHARPCAER